MTEHCIEKPLQQIQEYTVKYYEGMAQVLSKKGQPMLAFFGKQTLELRPFSALGKEGQVTEMDDYITAITASKDGRALLLNISMTKPRIELMSFTENEWRKTVQKYEGHTQTSYILKPQFGGFNENLVICGSEDSQILVWQRNSGE